MSLDAEAIKAELAELNHQRYEVNERIRSMGPVGRGRGRGFRGMPPGPAPYPPRRDDRSWDRGTRDVGPRDMLPPEEPRNPLDRQPSRRPFLARGPIDPEPAYYEGSRDPPPRRRLHSAVVVSGEARSEHDVDERHGHEGGSSRGGSKRQAEGELLEDNPALKKRNRRLFGALLGTLQKFKEEESQEGRADLAQRRAELLQRAEQKKEEESRRLREEARNELQSRRMEEINRKRELTMLADIKRLELLYAEKLARHDRLHTFLKTKAGPSVFWCPRKHNHLTLRLHEQQRQELQDWKGEQLELLEKEKAELRERFQRAASRGEEGGGHEGEEEGAQHGEEGHEGEQEGPQDMEAEGEGERRRGAARQNGEAAGGEGEGAAEGQQPQPAADDRYEAMPVGEAAHDEEMPEGVGEPSRHSTEGAGAVEEEEAGVAAEGDDEEH